MGGALERRGIEIGSHTVDHHDMTSLSDAEMLFDTTGVRWLATLLAAAQAS